MSISDLPFPKEVRVSARLDLTRGYAQELRAVGQALETLNLGDFSVEPSGNGYRVTGASVAKNLGLVRSAGGALVPSDPSVRVTPMDLNYSPGDVRRLEREGQAQRRSTGQTSEANTLPQILRVIGGVVDQMRGHLVAVSKEAVIVRLEYQSSSGQKVSEDYTMPMLYDRWVRMYKRREPGGNQ
ncbi:MAG: hypothetical protein ACXW4Z_17790 [Candidatus Binatia bacterium]